ncbi:MAG: AMMECR1 domain-containing protein [Candidatus Korobacteraceae bacterium]
MPEAKTLTSEYSAAERKQLLRLAHHAIAAELQGAALDKDSPSPHLSQPRGAFTSLHIHGRLRGCIGYVMPIHPLYRAVAETAAAAAFRDLRFEPVSDSDLPLLHVEIRLLLPQVPLQWGWDRERFLAETCRKAGLPADAWRHGAKIEAFTAEVFAENDPGDSLRD